MEKRWRIEISDGIRLGIGLVLSQVVLAAILIGGFTVLLGGCGAFAALLEAAGS